VVALGRADGDTAKRRDRLGTTAIADRYVLRLRPQQFLFLQ
jgi:hypothetical protein